MKYIYGVVGNQFVIGSLEYSDKPILCKPATIQLVSSPFINPITGQPDQDKVNIMIQAISMPVTWIKLDAVKVLCDPDENEAVVKTYLRSLETNATKK